MFSGAEKFNGNISSWNPKNVTSMNYMFQDATSFNRDISSWNISSAKEMNYMFMFASSYNQNLCDWGDKFPYDSATNIFFNSGCTNTSTPLWVSKGSWEYKKGPFCASASCPPFDLVSYSCSHSGCIISFTDKSYHYSLFYTHSQQPPLYHLDWYHSLSCFSWAFMFCVRE